MMVAYVRNMPHVATYWAPGSNDGTGGKTYAAPVVITCRWQNTAKLFRDGTGQQVVSEAIVYPDRELAFRGKLARGSFASASPVSAALEVRGIGSSDNLAGSVTLHKVWL